MALESITPRRQFIHEEGKTAVNAGNMGDERARNGRPPG